MVVDENTGELDFNDGSLTENTRAAFPMSFVGENVSKEGMAGTPTNIVMLTCDAFGVMPNFKIDSNQAVYHFLSGILQRLLGLKEALLIRLRLFQHVSLPLFYHDILLFTAGY